MFLPQFGRLTAGYLVYFFVRRCRGRRPQLLVGHDDSVAEAVLDLSEEDEEVSDDDHATLVMTTSLEGEGGSVFTREVVSKG